MELFKKPYEISLWDDVLTFVYEDGTISENKTIEGHGAIERQYYDEQKICVLGSDTMGAPIRAFNAKMVSKINGTNILTFELNSHYYDEESEQFLKNPFTSLLFNERKIKVREGLPGAPDIKWYDLIIKDVKEDSEKKIFTYTAKDQYINELSKTGYELIFDDEIENNVGTIEQLAEKVLQGSDWRVKESDKPFYELLEEPIYEVVWKKELKANLVTSSQETITITAGHTFYVFYNDVVNGKLPPQILYIDGNEKPQVNSENIITNAKNYFLERPGTLEDDFNYGDILSFSNSLPQGAIIFKISNYRGKRFVDQVETVFDPLLNKYVQVYTKDGKKQHVYLTTEYITPEIVQSCVVNGSALDSSKVGWTTLDNEGRLSNTITTVIKSYLPQPSEGNEIPTSKILTYFETKSRDKILNEGIMHNNHMFPKGIGFGEKYVFSAIIGNYDENEGKILLKDENNQKVVDGPAKNLPVLVAVARTWYDGAEKCYKVGPSIMRSWDYAEAWYDTTDKGTRVNIIMEATGNNQDKELLSHNDLKDQINKTTLLISFQNLPTDNTQAMAMTEVQFFPYIKKNDQNDKYEIIRPGEFSQLDDPTKSIVKKTYYSYEPKEDSNIISPDDIKYNYIGEELPEDYIARTEYNKYEKRRTLRASKSNRFNLISELCELFECWAKFEVERDNETGKINLDDNGHSIKAVSFHDYSNQEITNYAGFKYGINLKSISRQIESSNIASKLIVEDNSNEFGKGGYCSIERSQYNPTMEKFLYDFDYYIQKGMLNLNFVTLDLYQEGTNYLGYYKKLKEINIERDKLILEWSDLKRVETTAFSNLQSYTLIRDGISNEIQKNILSIKELTANTSWDGDIWGDWEKSLGTWSSNEEVVGYIRASQEKDASLREYTKLVEVSQANLEDIQKKIKTNEDILKEYAERKKILNEQFYKKYSRFIQEGTWVSEEYTDDNLYYFDAQNTLRASRSPKISYTINVLELSQIEGYENFKFVLAEKTYAEDVEFFGWKIDGSGQPYQEEVIITEITTYFDSPEKNQIKVQNHKTQFEDLFQRVQSSTQQLEYKTGAYDRVSGIVGTDGTIDSETLQNSFNNSALNLQNAKDQSVTWGDFGILTESINDPANKVKITNGAIQLTSDGGASWKTAITGRGIRADYIRSGQIDSDVVRIMSGTSPTFRWDVSGISAYKLRTNESGQVVQTYPDTFIRMDQFGLYGIKGKEGFNPLIPENGMIGIDKIKNNANFSLTWDGFQIKSINRGGYISITEDNDFEVVAQNTNGDEVSIIKIGQIGVEEEKPVFGLLMKDLNGIDTLKQTSNGRVWLSGEIEAKGGTIGDFNIKEHSLESTQCDDNGNPYISLSGGGGVNRIGGFRINYSTFSSDYDNIILDGAKSEIKVGFGENQILLDGAEGQIIVRTKPDPVGSVIDSIIIDSKSGSIQSHKFDRNQNIGWSIDGNEAIFNNITARGSLKASVFEYGEVQAVGGILLVRPSTRILSQDKITSGSDEIFTFKVESAEGFQNGDICLITPTPKEKLYFRIFRNEDSLDTLSNCTLIENSGEVSIENFSGMPIVNLGKPRTGESEGSIGIGINASTNSAAVAPQSISMFELIKENESYSYDTHLLLGKIPDSEEYGDLKGSYGLYADNVLLSGSLITKNFLKSSGIRTVTKGEENKIVSNKFGKGPNNENLDGEILLWAGAEIENGTSEKEQIQEANFQVNENGYLYAIGARFEGTVVSDAIIEASELKTAKITGTGQDPALIIQDAYTGIVFTGKELQSQAENARSGGEEKQIEYLRLDKDVFRSNIAKIEFRGRDLYTSSFIRIGDWKKTSTGESFDNKITISKKGIENNTFSLNFNENSSLNIKTKDSVIIEARADNFTVNKRLVLAQGISYQDDAAYLPVKGTDGSVVGYNLYIY